MFRIEVPDKHKGEIMSKKRVVGLIQARLGSSRFPEKIFQMVNGKTLIQIQIQRLKESKCLDDIGIVTTGSPQDDPVAEFCKGNSIKCYRGSEIDVLDRYYQAACKFEADVVVRLCGDCPLIDPYVVDELVGDFLSHPDGELDYLSNTEPLPTTYPDGMDVTVISFPALQEAWRNAVNPSAREHVTFYFYNNKDKFKVKKKDLTRDLSSYRFCVDYPEDVTLIEKIITEMDKRNIFGRMKELVDIVDEKGLKEINSKYKFGGGWKSAFAEDEKSKSSQAQKAPSLDNCKGNQLWEKVIEVIPGGAQTFSKMPYQHVEGVAPKFLFRGKGCKVWDLDGNEFIDSVLGLGAILVGHCRDEIDETYCQTAKEYFNTPSLPHPLEYDLALTLNEIIPSSEMVRYAKNGSDVTNAAVRLSRYVTGRDIIACTGYHGWHEWYIGATQRHAGIPEVYRNLTKVFEYNNFTSIEKIFKEHKDNVAAVILEPVNFYPPQGDFLHKLREFCNKNNTLLVFDEIVTGFRIDLGGAQKYFGVTPDLTCVGKSIANGYPLSALCGKAKYMREFKEVFFSGTFGGEIAALAAALKMIEIHKREKLSEHINKMGELLRDGFSDIIKELGINYCKTFGYGFWPKYSFEAVGDFSSREILTLFQQELVKRGVLTRSTVFVSLAHNEPDIRRMLQAMKESLLVVYKAVKEKRVPDYLEGSVIEPVIRDENIKH